MALSHCRLKWYIALMHRLYEPIIRDHFRQDRQMFFLSGPRQVGKTTVAHQALPNALSLNWDRDADRSLILSGQQAVLDRAGLTAEKGIIFDEIHKYPGWKNFLKGLFDSFGSRRVPVLVTGSARLNLYRKGTDSLTGRYFHYRMHPLSVGELCRPSAPATAGPVPPRALQNAEFDALYAFGGFPEPFLRRTDSFHRRWRQARGQAILREDLRDLTRVQEIGQVATLATLLRLQAGGALNYAAMATKLRAAQDSIRRWIAALEDLYMCFRLLPWTGNVARSLLKEPKVYFWDWSVVENDGARFENFVAVHLLKAAQVWTDQGFGDFGLHYIRTKDGREVDFVLTRDQAPWMLVECKTNDPVLSPALRHFAKTLHVPHAFQAVLTAPFQQADCFAVGQPVWTPARTLLSQLP